MLSGSKNTMGWLPGGKAEPGNGAQNQSLSQPTNAHPFWCGVGASSQQPGASPAHQAQQKKQCLFGVAKRMVGRLPPEGGLRQATCCRTPGICICTAGESSGSDAKTSEGLGRWLCWGVAAVLGSHRAGHFCLGLTQPHHLLQGENSCRGCSVPRTQVLSALPPLSQ